MGVVEIAKTKELREGFDHLSEMLRESECKFLVQFFTWFLAIAVF